MITDVDALNELFYYVEKEYQIQSNRVKCNSDRLSKMGHICAILGLKIMENRGIPLNSGFL